MDNIKTVYGYLANKLADTAKEFGIDLDIQDEQAFLMSDAMEDQAVACVSFGDSDNNSVVTTQDFTVTVLSTANNLKKTQEFLEAFVEKYSMRKAPGMNAFVVLLTPKVDSNFNEIDHTFRSVLSVDGSVVISNSASAISIEYGGEEIFCISCGIATKNQLDPQPDMDNGGTAMSLIQMSTDTLTIGTYLFPTGIAADAVKGWCSTGPEDRLRKYQIKVQIGEVSAIEGDFILSEFQLTQSIGEFASVSLSFVLCADEGAPLS